MRDLIKDGFDLEKTLLLGDNEYLIIIHIIIKKLFLLDQ